MNKGRGSNRTGRSKSEQYFQIPYSMAHSLAWRSLSGGAMKVYMELRTRFHGGNNGKIYLSMSECSNLLAMSRSTAKRAFDELIDKGFITCTKEGSWYGRKAAEYSITDKGLDGHLPTYAWKQWRPPKFITRYSHGTVIEGDGAK